MKKIHVKKRPLNETNSPNKNDINNKYTGIKTIKDIEEDRKNFSKKDKKQLVEYDWLNEN